MCWEKERICSCTLDLVFWVNGSLPCKLLEDQGADFDVLKGCQNVEISDELGFGVWNTSRRPKLKLGPHNEK